MPDPIPLLQAMAAAPVIAAAVFLLCAWPWRAPRPALVSAGCALGVSIGFFVGCRLLGVTPHWPPQEDQDRLLLILLPAVAAVEVAAAFLGRCRWCAWLLRAAVAAAAAPILLYGTTYLGDAAGPGTREWPLLVTWLFLAALAAALAIVWVGLVLLQRRAPGLSLSLAVALACIAAAVAVMLSSYTSGGQLGFPLAAALAGAVLASFLAATNPTLDGAIGLGVVGLFALAVVGRFFGQLTTANAALLFFAPLLCWLPELPYLRRVTPLLGGFLKILCTAAPLIVALTLARQKFIEDSSARTSPTSPEPSLQDYLDFQK